MKINAIFLATAMAIMGTTTAAHGASAVAIQSDTGVDWLDAKPAWINQSPVKVRKHEKRFDVTKFGALGDGVTVNTKAIQAAIDKCAKHRGGGVVVVPKGTFLSGAIFLKQGVNLMVEKDGVLKGTTNPDDYPQIQTRWEGTEEMWTSAFVNADGMTDLEISGGGTIDGSGEEWVQKNSFRRRPPTAPGDTPLAASTVPMPPPPPPMPNPAMRRGRPRLIGIQNCKRVWVHDVNLHNQAVWGLFILYSEDVLAENLRITAEHNIPSSDGMDIDSSTRVHVNHVYIDDDDDCVSIKSGKDADGLRVNRPAKDILIENSHFAYGEGGVAMGSETSGGIHDVEVRNCVFDTGNWAPIRFKSQPSRSGVVENITYRDITLHGTKQAFEFNLEWRMVPPIAPPAKVLPVVRNVRIINVSGDVQSVGIIHGLSGSPIEGILFENCKITADKGFKLDHARNVDMKGLSLDVKEGDAITETDVQ
jgi:polygalacturonase